LRLSTPSQANWGVYTSAISQITGSVSLNDNAWHFLVGTYDGSQIILYVDKVAVANAAVTGNINQVSTSLKIGTGQSYTFNGIIDDVHLYNRALSAAEIAALYNGGK